MISAVVVVVSALAILRSMHTMGHVQQETMRAPEVNVCLCLSLNRYTYVVRPSGLLFEMLLLWICVAYYCCDAYDDDHTPE